MGKVGCHAADKILPSTPRHKLVKIGAGPTLSDGNGDKSPISYCPFFVFDPTATDVDGGKGKCNMFEFKREAEDDDEEEETEEEEAERNSLVAPIVSQ